MANSFTLLSKINISNSLYEPLSKIIVTFLSIEDDLAWHELEEFGKLLKSKGNLFTDEQILKMLEIAIEKDKPNNNKYEKCIKDISLALNKHYLINKRLIKKAIANINNTSKWYYVSYLILVSDENCKKILFNEIEELLDDKFDIDFYDHLIRKQLYDYNKKDYFEKLVEDISNCKEIGFKDEFKNGHPQFEGFRFYNFIILLNILKIDRKSELLNCLTNISEYEKWLLRPKEYNYSNFDAKWVLASDNRYILNSLKEIKELNIAIEKELKKEFNSKLSEIYYKYLN